MPPDYSDIDFTVLEKAARRVLSSSDPIRTVRDLAHNTELGLSAVEQQALQSIFGAASKDGNPPDWYKCGTNLCWSWF